MLRAAMWGRLYAGCAQEGVKTGGRKTKARRVCVLRTRRRYSGSRTPSNTQTNLIMLEIYCRGTSFDSVFVVVFVIIVGTQFFMVAGPSVGAVKHSGVFSCDWDSLEEENVRHGAWLSARWSSSGGLREEEAGRAELSFPLPPALSILSFLAASLLCPAALSPILFSFPFSISQQGFISCDSLKPIISSLPASVHS